MYNGEGKKVIKETTTFFPSFKNFAPFGHMKDTQGTRRVYPGATTAPGIDGMAFFPLSCLLHVTTTVFRADRFHPSTTSKKKTINAPRVLLDLDPPAHPQR